MKVAIYYPWVYLKSGVERTILEIVKRSKHEYTIFTNHFDKENTYPEFSNLRVIELKKVPVRRNLIDVLKAAMVIIFQKIDLRSFDLLLVHSEGLGDMVLFRNSEIPSVCFCHTPLRPVFDIEYRKRVYRKKNFFNKILYHLFAFIFKTTDKYLWRKYDYIFFNSRETLRRAKRGGLLEKLKGRYGVLHPGVDTKKMKPSWVFKPYFLLPARIMWTKNIELGIRSFIKSKEKSKDLDKFSLVIAGLIDEKSKSYLNFLKKIAKGRHDIKFVISPSDKVLNKLYSECWAVVLTSFNEDWGLTLIEGNAFGKPSICVNRGGLRESQINNKTGYLVEPNIKSFAKALGRIAADKNLVMRLGKNARINSLKYDWGNFTQRLDKLVSKLGK